MVVPISHFPLSQYHISINNNNKNTNNTNRNNNDNNKNREYLTGCVGSDNYFGWHVSCWCLRGGGGMYIGTRFSPYVHIRAHIDTFMQRDLRARVAAIHVTAF